jgi:phosphoribosylformylglycinamidine synthase
VALWHKDRDVRHCDAIVLPGGFSYGDYLRCGAIARVSPIMDAVAQHAREGGVVIGICNGFQILCEAGLLPGALLANRSLKFVCEITNVRVETTDTAFTYGCRQGEVLSVPIKHGEGLLRRRRDDAGRDRGSAGRSVFRYADRSGRVSPEANPNGSLNNIAGVCNAERNVVGLMPHPEHAAGAAPRRRRRLEALSLGAGLGGARQPCAAPRADGRARTVTRTPVTVDTAIGQGLTAEEYASIVQRLGRTPTFEEVAVFGVMWSEHCSYKSSRAYLKQLPTTGTAGPAGARARTRAPSTSATGSRPSSRSRATTTRRSSSRSRARRPASAASCATSSRWARGRSRSWTRSGSAASTIRGRRTSRAAWSPGSATTATASASRTSAATPRSTPAYDHNILVNAFTLGIAPPDRIFRAKAAGPGNPVIYVGSRTGRDGIHGASLLASASLDALAEEKRPAVQVGDPFTEKLLLEACLELMQTDHVVAIQDMGAAGLTSSSVEMAGRGEVGIVIDLDMVPFREEGMIPYEILLSESQERMLIVAKQGSEDAVRAIFERWDLQAVVIGTLTDDGVWRARWHGEDVAAIPAGDPHGRRRRSTSGRRGARALRRAAGARPPHDPRAVRLHAGAPDAAHEPEPLLARVDLPPVRPVRRRCVGRAARRRRGGRANRGIAAAGLAMAVDCNSRYTRIDPYLGAVIAVVEAARNCVAVGAKPLALTDCLNFGNPERPTSCGSSSRRSPASATRASRSGRPSSPAT